MNFYSPEAEKAVLGVLLLDNSAWPIVKEQLTFKDFYRREHQVLFDIISKKLEQGECVDNLSLSNEVKTIPELKEINGELYVFELFNQTYSISNIASHAAIVKNHSQRRKFKEILDYLDKHANEGDIKALVQQAYQELDQLIFTPLPTHHGILYQKFLDIQPQAIDWLWPNQIARGKVSIIAGNPGLGKSQITAYMAAVVSNGGVWPIEQTKCNPGGVIFLSAEDDPADTIRPRLEAIGADLSKVYIIKLIENKKQGKDIKRSFNLKTDLPNLEKLLKEISDKELSDIALIVIDPITAYLGQTDSYNNAEVRGLLTPLSELATKYNVAIVAVSHLNKNSSQEPLLRVAGSLAFVAAARSAFIVIADPNDKKRRFLLPTKNNISEDNYGFAFSIQSCWLKDCQIATSKVVWEKETVNEDVLNLMKTSDDPEERGALQEAIDFLADLLKDRSMSVKKIKTLAHQSGHSQITLRRAKERLGIIYKKESFLGDWVWILPKEINSSHLDHADDLAHTQKDEQLDQDGRVDNFLHKAASNYPYSEPKKNNFNSNCSNLVDLDHDHDLAHIGCVKQHDEQDELDKLLSNSIHNELDKQNLTKIEENNAFVIDLDIPISDGGKYDE
ncbi:AAA family ATPase [Rickettsiella endosymbiont of Dermanyssus gallinae]|uniref:AAA family ATPase n=1 Tax=Rickettsiella endosymbiont of Dermanyssus gallinae TaxID=2856608 RepID=UPI001C52751B|nr:AAA family ATPase [Rickettsiella endosymbiont of Dermanyssus gallinae]